MKILITGDFVINQPYSTENIDQEVIDLFHQSDYNIVNLEAPVTNSNSKILKTGPHLKSDKENTLSVLKTLNVDLVTLANNHVLDYDEQGVLDTLAFCKENSIATVGAGKNKEEASKISYLDTPEGRIAIINIAENEWASATENTAGANPMDIIDNAHQIKEAKENANFVFVIVHGGQNYFDLPSPNIKKRYRFYVELGADLVVSHHSHSVSGYENYKGKYIYYGLGNFLFTKHSNKNCWYSGMFLQIQINNNNFDVSYKIISQNKKDFGLILLNEANGLLRFKEYIDSLNKTIVDDEALRSKWNEFVEERTYYYVSAMAFTGMVPNRYLRVALKKIGIDRFLKLKGYKTRMLNFMRCESHRELTIMILNNHLKNKK